MLGSALCRALGRTRTELFTPAEPFHWGREPELAIQAATAVQAFAARSGAAQRWEIYWAAGVGHMGSSDTDLAPETRALSILLRLVGSEKRLLTTPGAMAFASSAGAIYAGSPDYTITENTSPVPTTAYAREKLVQEDLMRSFADANSPIPVLIARLSTIYGPGQSAGKPQGLLAHIARCMLRHRPVQIYVPFDTIRDYIFSNDAAAAMVSALQGITGMPRVLTRIVASECPTTIAEIVATFKRIERRAPRVVTSAGRLSDIYPRRVRFRSLAGPESVRAPKTSLLVGIAQLMASERAAFVRSSVAAGE